MNISKFFIDRPIFAGVLSVLILLAGIIAMFKLPISEYPEVVPPSVVVHAQYPGANPKVIAETVASPLEEQINGVEDMLYMQSQANSDGNLTHHRHVQARHRPGQGAAAGAEPRVASAAAPAGRREAARRDDHQVVADADDGGSPDLAEQPLRHDVSAQLRADQREGPARADPGRGRSAAVGLGRLLDAHLARSAEGRAARHDGDRRRQRDPRAERAGGGRRDRRIADLVRTCRCN